MKTFTRTMRILVVMGSLILTNLILTSNVWGQSTCYSVNGETDKMVKLSLSGSTITGVDSFSLSYGGTALANVGASALYNDTLWFINAEHLYFIANPGSTISRLSSNQIDSNITEDADIYNGMSFDNQGRLWVVNSDDAISATGIFLSVINRSTGLIDGALTPGGTDVIEVNGITEGEITSIEFDPLTNELYASVQNGGLSLYKIVLNPGTNWTADAQIISNMASLGIEGLTFTDAGRMIASTNLGKMYFIDQNAALWQQITSTVSGDFGTIACDPRPVDFIGISGYVFNDDNLNGTLDVGENGGNNITVSLYLDANDNGILDGTENTIVASVNTNLNGFYDMRIPFTGDQYIIVTDVGDYPSSTNYQYFKLAIDPSSGSAGDFYPNNNFTYYYGLLITGRVYEDLNQDSSMQVSEDVDNVNLSGIVVELYDDDNCDGVANTGTWLDTVVVDETGEFVFTEKYDGDLSGSGAGNTKKLVSGPTDDAVEDAGFVFFGADSINIGTQIAAFRFKNIGLKVGDVVVEARVKFTAAGNSSGIVETNIACELDVDASAVKTGQTSDLSNRKNSLTSTTSWIINEDWTDGNVYYSPNVASAFQEVIDLPAYATAKNSSFLLFFLDPDDNGRWIRTKDYNGAPYAPELTMQWTDGTGSDCYVLKVNVDSKLPKPTVTEGGDDYALTFTTSIDTVEAYFGVFGQAVPVTWLDFTADKIGDAALLNWSTSQEINNDYFTVQHSVDGVNYTDIGVVKGAGNTVAPEHYEFIHANPIMGVNYYRIKQTDFNGSYDYSVVRTVNFGGPLGEIHVTPNPVKGSVTVEIPEHIGGTTTVSVLNMEGKVLMTRTLDENEMNNGSAVIDMNGVETGVYMITLESVDQIFTNRVIKN